MDGMDKKRQIPLYEWTIGSGLVVCVFLLVGFFITTPIRDFPNTCTPSGLSSCNQRCGSEYEFCLRRDSGGGTCKTNLYQCYQTCGNSCGPQPQ